MTAIKALGYAWNVLSNIGPVVSSYVQSRTKQAMMSEEIRRLFKG